MSAPARTNPSVGNPLRTKAVVSALLAEDTTVDAGGRPYVGDGILVALDEFGLKVTPRAVQALNDLALTLADLVEQWVEARSGRVLGNYTPARYYGSWRDGDDLYFDVVEAYSSAEEDRAIDAARARGELAVWHNGRKEEIRVNA